MNYQQSYGRLVYFFLHLPQVQLPGDPGAPERE